MHECIESGSAIAAREQKVQTIFAAHNGIDVSIYPDGYSAVGVMHWSSCFLEYSYANMRNKRCLNHTKQSIESQVLRGLRSTKSGAKTSQQSFTFHGISRGSSGLARQVELFAPVRAW